MSKSAQESAFDEFFAESDEILQRVTQALTVLEATGASHLEIDSIYRDVHTLKGSAQLFGFNSIGLVAHALEASLEPVRQKRTNLDSSFVDLIFSCLDLISRILHEPSLDLNKDSGLQIEVASLISKLIETATGKFEQASALVREGFPGNDSQFHAEISNDLKITEAPENEVEIMSRSLPEKNQEEPMGETNTIRVQVGLLDKLMNLVGEMVLTRNQVLQYAKVHENNEFLKLTQRLDLITTELQDNVMRTRMQPIGPVFSKFQRIVRDLCRNLGKNVELSILGAESELDKSLIEAIKDPLTHIVRNACDHGIELPEKRKSLGKSEMGKLSLKAYHEGGHMIIEIHDDGAGIDPKKIIDKAIAKKIITSDQAKQLSDKQAQELILLPGFTTADEVSTYSGRGVGMDVVKTNIEKIGGVVELESMPKFFTRIRLRIPLTLAIVPVMIVSCASEIFAIPQVKLQELIRVDMDEGGKIESLEGRLFYRLRDQLLPLVSFSQMLCEKSVKSQNVYNIVVLNSLHSSYGLIVDEIKDTSDIVVKPLPRFLKKVDMFSGATIMGDGSVALIVDTEGVSQHALGDMKQKQHSDSQTSSLKRGSSLSMPEYLLVQLNQQTYTIPLVLVYRLEEFKPAQLNHSAGEILVNYRGGLLPLIDIKNILLLENEVDESREVYQVVVISKNNRFYGILVDQILDICQPPGDIIPHLRPVPGLLGTVHSQETGVLSVLDTYAIINNVSGETSGVISKVKKNTRILLAEDTMFFVKQISKILIEAGIEVTHAPDGESAYQMLEEAGPKHFSLIISDIEMPKLDGFSLAKKIKSHEFFKHLPLVALTTRFKEADQARGKECGFNKYLEKLHHDELIETINELLGEVR